MGSRGNERLKPILTPALPLKGREKSVATEVTTES
ncbi:MAG: hypothetical protein AzoDbin1_04588 [Azoarcus sp.]|nr:hypothetical protein [Azoarcus sp.]